MNEKCREGREKENGRRKSDGATFGDSLSMKPKKKKKKREDRLGSVSIICGLFFHTLSNVR
jgi:hypothetical protein